jgi:hypothetical protein
MHNMLIFVFFFGASFLLSAAASEKQSDPASALKPSLVRIQQIGGRSVLTKDGEPYFIKGAGGSAYLDKLVEAGGNSIRSWSSSRELLDKAHEKGLSVCMGLGMRNPRHGADYQDTTMLKAQRERIIKDVMGLKDHPALLMWGIGNEVEHSASPEDCLRVWNEIEVIATMIKEIDKHHPVITVIAGAGKKLEDIKRLCPTLDALGINSYGELSYVPSQIREYGWEKPYLITEFGPRGWWEAPKTAWGLPLEDSSTEKSEFYYNAYLAGIDNKPNCLGSYVFLWGNKQEKTHTWFNMFLPDGSPTEMVDTMTRLWTGRWPENRAPKIGNKKIYPEATDPLLIFKASGESVFYIDASDPDGDEMTLKWDIRKDESDNPSIGGDREPRIPPIENAVISSESNRVVIRMPEEAGNYRIFAYVFDPSGKAATVNLPIQVK